MKENMTKKKSKMDFVLNDSPLYGDKIVFRFFPAKSHVHGFDDNPPKNRDEIYKVYYSWQILLAFEETVEETNKTKTIYKKVFDMPWDECSEVANLHLYIDEVISKKKDFSVPFTVANADWEISYRKGIKSVGQKEDLIDFKVWQKYMDVGYRFSLYISEALNFKTFLENVNQYMLEHGEGI